MSFNRLNSMKIKNMASCQPFAAAIKLNKSKSNEMQLATMIFPTHFEKKLQFTLTQVIIPSISNGLLGKPFHSNEMTAISMVDLHSDIEIP